ncbi:MAG: hypothetical protein ABH871_10375 [Pseudomonadota bacterium]
MPDIRKATRVAERELRFREEDAKVQAEKQRIIEELRHGNIHEIFARETKFKISDFTDFFSHQWRNFKSQIVQDAEIKASEASCPAPDINDFSVHHDGTTISPEEGELLSDAMSGFLTSGTGAGKFKGQSVGGKGIPAEGAPLLPEELGEMAQGTIGEWDQFLEDSWGTIFDAQLSQEMQKRMGEVKQEVQKIISLAKEGKIGVEFVLIALAKVNSTKNGVLMSGLGKKMYHINQGMSDVANELNTLSPTDPRYYGMMQMGREKTRDGSFQLNLLQTDMQKVMQDIASTMEFVHSSIGEINRTRREIIAKYTAAG